MSGRPKRKRKKVSYVYEEAEEVEEEPKLPPAHLTFADCAVPQSRAERLQLPFNILEHLDDDLFEMLVGFLRAQDVALVRRLSHHLLVRTNRCRPLIDDIFLHAAKQWMQWDYVSAIPDRNEGMITLRVELAKLEDCWHCGGRCKGIYFPAQWRQRGFKLKEKLCLGCFGELNPTLEMLSARAADEAYGTDAASRKTIQHVIANLGYRRMKKYYLTDDLKALQDARKKAKTK